jgi:hypothetical protein
MIYNKVLIVVLSLLQADNTLLMWAAAAGGKKMAVRLILEGADPYEQNLVCALYAGTTVIYSPCAHYKCTNVKWFFFLP